MKVRVTLDVDERVANIFARSGQEKSFEEFAQEAVEEACEGLIRADEDRQIAADDIRPIEEDNGDAPVSMMEVFHA